MRAPRGRISLRKFVMFFATILVACLAYILASAPTTYAADASWDNNSIVYQNNTFQGPKTAQQGDGTELADGVKYYLYLPTGNNGPRKAHVIYFAPGADPPKETQATFAQYDSGNNGQLSNKSAVTPITLTPASQANTTTDSDTDTAEEGTTSCVVEGIGWIVCPITMFLAEGMDWIYSLIDGFLEVRPLATSQNQPMYRAWSFMRDFANVAFVIGFLILVYGQLSGGLLSNYMIKKMLPRIIVAAILVNVSYWICSIAVDVFNIMGYSVQDLFIQMRNSLVGSEGNSWDVISWESMAALVLSGGSIAAGVGIGAYLGITSGALAVAGAGIAGGIIMLLLPLLLGMLFVVLVTFLILAARQAIITILIILAPLAFVAYLLPNTEKWFDKWRDAFFTLLLVFPAFSVIFGGSQLAAAAIMQNANSINIILLAMAVQVAPLAITPLLLKLGGGVLNRFAAVVNNPTKGMFDRGKNWARDRNEQNKSAGRAALDERAKMQGFVAGRPPRSGRPTRRGRFAENARNRMNPNNLAYQREYSRREREGMKSANEEMSAGLFTQTTAGRRIHDRSKDAGLEKHFGEATNQERWNNAVYGNPTTGAAGDQYRQHLHHAAHTASGRANVVEEAAKNAAERDLQTQINATAGLRDLKIQSDVDASHAKLQASNVEADAGLAYQMEVEASRALTRIVKDTHHSKKQAEQFETIVQKAAEKSWNDRIRNDDPTRELYLRAVRNEDGAVVAEQKVKSMVEEIKAVGDAAPGLVTVTDKTLAGHIKDNRRGIEIEEQVQTSAKVIQQRDLVAALKADSTLRQRAAGVDDHGEVRVLAGAKKAVSDELIKMTNNFYDTMDYDIASNPKKLEEKWREAEAKGEISEIIAYGRKLAMNAPGLRTLKPLLEDFTRGKNPLDDEVMLLKEVLGSDSAFRDAGRDLEVWANNETNPATDKAYKDFAEVRKAAAPWANITASRFARMNAYSQEEALYWLQQDDLANGTNRLQGLLAGIGDETGTIWRELKGSTRGRIDEIRAGGYIPNPNP